MSGIGWPLVEVVSQFLDREEREAVQGDLLESGVGAWRSFLDVLGLVVRRQALLWKSWRPWLAAFALALPGSLLLMGLSVSVSLVFRHLIIDPRIFQAAGPMVVPGFSLLICRVLLLTGWSWAGGFVVGSVSRGTVWVSAAFCFSACLFCLSTFREEYLSRLCLLLFLLPAIWGVRQGLRVTRLKLSSAIVLAIAVTVLMILTVNGRASSIVAWTLIWPVWYIAATARRPGTTT